MDENQFQKDIDSLFSERHCNILVALRQENPKHLELMRNIANTEELAKSQVSESTWLLIKRLIGLVNLQSHVESKHLYAKGIKDCIFLARLLDVEYTNLSYNDV